MRKITASLDKNVKKISKANVLDASYFVRQSWDQVSKNTIEKCFQQAFSSLFTQVESDEDIAYRPFRRSHMERSCSWD